MKSSNPEIQKVIEEINKQNKKAVCLNQHFAEFAIEQAIPKKLGKVVVR